MGSLYFPLKHKIPSQNLIFIFLLFTVVSADSNDKSVLLELKSSVSDPKGLLSSWNQGSTNHCTWAGVLCGLNSRVVALNISGNGVVKGNSCSGFLDYPLYAKRGCKGTSKNGKLVGKLPGLVAKLDELRVLSLPFNGFVGEVPREVWGMKRLEIIDLEGNSLSGSIPVEGLGSLRVLNLGFNRIGGGIPEWLSGLEVLNLAGNRITGSVPVFVGRLREVYLSFNELGGEVDEKIGEGCQNLERLDLSGNFLTGGIPRSLGNCGRLRSLLLYSNMFNDVVPAELGRLQSLQVLDLSRNSLSGAIPAELGNCSELSVIVLSNLFNPLPDVSGRKRGASVDQLNPMIDDFNYFLGGVPSEVIALPKLSVLWAPRATLQGRFPSDWSSCRNLEMINLAQNFFTGEISQGLTNCKKLFFLDLSSNWLSGLLPEELPVPCMTFFVVSGNMLSGPIPRFNNTSCYPLSYINEKSSDSGTQSLVHVYQSFFEYRAREGSALQIPGEHSSLEVYHDFGRNNFSGTLQSMPIAPEISNRQIAYSIVVGGNKLSGPFPSNLFEKCPRLYAVSLDVSSNRIYGQIPADIGRMCKPLKLLDVSENQLTGPIPTGIGELVSLIALNLSHNMLQGHLPPSIGEIKSLKNLSFASNNLTGSIPSSLGQLHSLEVLELYSNSLSGDIPNDLVKLMNLTILLLNNNKLSGKIPSGLKNGASLSAFNLSYNNLSGPIPSNDDLLKCSTVLGNPLLQTCHTYTLSASPSVDPQESVGESQGDVSSSSENQYRKSKNSEFNSIEIASIASASAIVSVLIALIILFVYTRKWKPMSRISSIKREVTIFIDIGAPLTYESIVQATGGFHASNCIGFGAFGSTYKAEITPQVSVAIKRLAVGRFQGFQQFEAEIKTLGRLRHQNLVTLVGYHASESEMFLIYNYLPGGNLQKFIQERSRKPVHWRILHKIALDIARALAYLHDTCVPRVLHRDVKPNNILLDDDYNAYLSDFGLARLLGTSETHATTAPAGTFGYVAPEYAMTCRVSDKADVYSYGVVLLELLSDKKVLDPSFSEYGSPFNIVQWAGMLIRHGRAKEFFTAGLWDVGPHDDLIDVLHLALVCTVESLSTRPTMRQVVRRLRQLQPPSTC